MAPDMIERRRTAPRASECSREATNRLVGNRATTSRVAVVAGAPSMPGDGRRAPPGLYQGLGRPHYDGTATSGMGGEANTEI